MECGHTKVNAKGQVEGTCVGTGMAFDPAFYYHRPTSLFRGARYGPTLLAGAEILTLLRIINSKLMIILFSYCNDNSKSIFNECKSDAHEEYARRHNPIWRELEQVFQITAFAAIRSILSRKRASYLLMLRSNRKKSCRNTGDSACKRWWDILKLMRLSPYFLPLFFRFDLSISK